MGLHGATAIRIGVVTGQSDIEEVGLCTQLSEGPRDIRLEIVPAETKVLGGTHLDDVVREGAGGDWWVVLRVRDVGEGSGRRLTENYKLEPILGGTGFLLGNFL